MHCSSVPVSDDVALVWYGDIGEKDVETSHSLKVDGYNYSPIMFNIGISREAVLHIAIVAQGYLYGQVEP